NAFTGPLFGIYLLALFSTRATSTPVLAGALAGSFTSYYVAYHTQIGFMWPSTAGLTATLTVALVLTAIFRTRAPESALAVTWWNVMARREPAESGVGSR